jgi:hypothetical protein
MAKIKKNEIKMAKIKMVIIIMAKKTLIKLIWLN